MRLIQEGLIMSREYYRKIKHVFTSTPGSTYCAKCEEPKAYEQHYFPGPVPSEGTVDFVVLCDAIENIARGFVGLGDATATAIQNEANKTANIKTDLQALVTELLRQKATLNFAIESMGKRLDAVEEKAAQLLGFWDAQIECNDIVGNFQIAIEKRLSDDVERRLNKLEKGEAGQ